MSIAGKPKLSELFAHAAPPWPKSTSFWESDWKTVRDRARITSAFPEPTLKRVYTT